MSEKSKIIVEKIINELNYRGGFDSWWEGIDIDTQEEIKEDLKQIVNKEL